RRRVCLHERLLLHQRPLLRLLLRLLGLRALRLGPCLPPGLRVCEAPGVLLAASVQGAGCGGQVCVSRLARSLLDGALLLYAYLGLLFFLVPQPRCRCLLGLGRSRGRRGAKGLLGCGCGCGGGVVAPRCGGCCPEPCCADRADDDATADPAAAAAAAAGAAAIFATGGGVPWRFLSDRPPNIMRF
ncbi:unnamed protein product, partial [Ectocarpus sp. 8 AP-2014]